MYRKGQIVYRCFFPQSENDPYALYKYEITDCPDDLQTDGQKIKYKRISEFGEHENESTFGYMKDMGFRPSASETVVSLINQLAEKVANAGRFVENTARAMVILEALRRTVDAQEDHQTPKEDKIQ